MLTPTKPPGSANALTDGIGHREELEVPRAVGPGGDEPVPELVQVVVDLRIVEIAARAADLAHHDLAELALLCGRTRAPATRRRGRAATSVRWPCWRRCGIDGNESGRTTCRSPRSVAGGFPGRGPRPRPGPRARADRRKARTPPARRGCDAGPATECERQEGERRDMGGRSGRNTDAKMRDACRSSRGEARFGAHTECRVEIRRGRCGGAA